MDHDMFRPLPDAFDSIAAMSRLGEAAELAPSFHARHQRAIERAVVVVQVLEEWDPDFRVPAGFSVDMTATALRGWFTSASPRLKGRDIFAFDQMMTTVMTGLLPVVRDPDQPAALEECRWGIEAAFGRPDDPEPTVDSAAKELNDRGVERDRRGDSKGAIADYTTVINLPHAPVNQVAEAHYNRGLAKTRVGDRDGAIADYTTVLELADAPADLMALALVNRGVLRARGAGGAAAPAGNPRPRLGPGDAR
jgi:tetratricopeptide (TPR) repeat protein